MVLERHGVRPRRARARFGRPRLATACLLLAYAAAVGSCRINYELFDAVGGASNDATVGSPAGLGSTDGGGELSVGAASGNSPTAGGSSSSSEPTSGAPAGGTPATEPNPGAECATSDDCVDGTCIDGACESVGLGSGAVLTFGYDNSDHDGVVVDTFIEETSPMMSFEYYGFLVVQGVPTRVVSLMRFDLSAMPPGVTVTGGNLTLDVWMDPITTGRVTLHELLEPRTVGQTTWLERATGVPWTAAGCGVGSRSADILGHFTPLTTAVYDIPLAASVLRRWVEDPSTNHGLALVGEGSDYLNLRPAGVGSGVKPQLSISYR